jgi:hypothetical protein
MLNCGTNGLQVCWTNVSVPITFCFSTAFVPNLSCVYVHMILLSFGRDWIQKEEALLNQLIARICEWSVLPFVPVLTVRFVFFLWLYWHDSPHELASIWLGVRICTKTPIKKDITCLLHAHLICSTASCSSHTHIWRLGTCPSPFLQNFFLFLPRPVYSSCTGANPTHIYCDCLGIMATATTGERLMATTGNKGWAAEGYCSPTQEDNSLLSSSSCYQEDCNRLRPVSYRGAF